MKGLRPATRSATRRPVTGPLVPLGTPEDHCHLTKGFIFLDRLFDEDDDGGQSNRNRPTF